MTRIRIKQSRPRLLPDPILRGDRQPAKPLTHHEILTLMAPFTRRGLHADMNASRREDRLLSFKSSEHAASDELPICLQAWLTLDASSAQRYRLVRQVTDETGLVSTATVEGAALDALLGQMDALPVQRQFRVYDGIPVARSYVIDVPADAGLSKKAAVSAGGAVGAVVGRVRSLRRHSDAEAPPAAPGPDEAVSEPIAQSGDADAGDAPGVPRPILVEASARIAGAMLTLKADRLGGPAVEVKLTADPGFKLKIPEDLVAVLGWPWRPLREFVSYWRGGIRVSGSEPTRTADIELKLARTVKHLARTLAQSPERFHDRFRRARWRVSFQRGIPLMVGLLILAITPAVQFLRMEDDSILRMLIFHAPPMMLVGFFMMREMPRIEIPPLPRRLINRSWIVPTADKAPRHRTLEEAKPIARQPTPAEAET
jgi:hypothetical protein